MVSLLFLLQVWAAKLCLKAGQALWLWEEYDCPSMGTGGGAMPQGRSVVAEKKEIFFFCRRQRSYALSRECGTWGEAADALSCSV